MNKILLIVVSVLFVSGCCGANKICFTQDELARRDAKMLTLGSSCTTRVTTAVMQGKIASDTDDFIQAVADCVRQETVENNGIMEIKDTVRNESITFPKRPGPGE